MGKFLPKWTLENKIEAASIIVGFVAVVLGIIMGLNQFNRGQKVLKEIEMASLYTQDSLQTEQQLLNLKIESTSKMANAIGAILATDTSRAEFDQAWLDFNKIYYGESILIEDDTIGSLMKQFKLSVSDYMRGFVSKVNLNQQGILLCSELKQYLNINESVYKKETGDENK